MIAIIFGCFFMSYYFSRNVIKSVLNTIIIYFSIPILSAFIYFCPKNNFCLFKVDSYFFNHQYYSFYWLMFSFFYFMLFLFPEFFNYIKNNNRIFKLKYFIICIILFTAYLFKIVSITNDIFDIVLMSILYIFIFYSVLFTMKHIKDEKYLRINLFFILYDVFAVNTILLSIF